MKKLLLVLVSVSLLLTACGAGPTETTTSTPAEQEAPTPTMPSATSAAILPTPTPVPPPPTPTPLPTNTPAPTQEAATVEATATPAVTDVMVEIPAGPFTMGTDNGSPDEGPAHEVDVPAFQIDKFDVTNADFAIFVQVTGYETYAEKNETGPTWRDKYSAGKENHPVVYVTWNDAVAYCDWLGKRLPSESEWEKAARGPQDFVYPWGNDWDPSKANVKESGLRGTTAVGSYPPNSYGLFDMAGNVWQWTDSWYEPYPGNTTSDPYYGEQFRVVRGGGWFEEAPQVTTYNRNAADPNATAHDDLGFRCAQ